MQRMNLAEYNVYKNSFFAVEVWKVREIFSLV